MGTYGLGKPIVRGSWLVPVVAGRSSRWVNLRWW